MLALPATFLFLLGVRTYAVFLQVATIVRCRTFRRHVFGSEADIERQAKRLLCIG
jgi:hypothetical protein